MGWALLGFTIGSDKKKDEKPAHPVRIRERFYVGLYEVTQKQWQVVMGDNPGHFRVDDLPVERVSWDDAKRFISKLNDFYDGFAYRLPTEAEWEYACHHLRVCLPGTVVVNRLQ